MVLSSSSSFFLSLISFFASSSPFSSFPLPGLLFLSSCPFLFFFLFPSFSFLSTLFHLLLHLPYLLFILYFFFFISVFSCGFVLFFFLLPCFCLRFHLSFFLVSAALLVVALLLRARHPSLSPFRLSSSCRCPAPSPSGRCRCRPICVCVCISISVSGRHCLCPSLSSVSSSSSSTVCLCLRLCPVRLSDPVVIVFLALRPLFRCPARRFNVNAVSAVGCPTIPVTFRHGVVVPVAV